MNREMRRQVSFRVRPRSDRGNRYLFAPDHHGDLRDNYI